MMHLLV
jgi:hypothetical protein